MILSHRASYMGGYCQISGGLHSTWFLPLLHKPVGYWPNWPIVENACRQSGAGGKPGMRHQCNMYINHHDVLPTCYQYCDGKIDCHMYCSCEHACYYPCCNCTPTSPVWNAEIPSTSICPTGATPHRKSMWSYPAGQLGIDFYPCGVNHILCPDTLHLPTLCNKILRC